MLALPVFFSPRNQVWTFKTFLYISFMRPNASAGATNFEHRFRSLVKPPLARADGQVRLWKL
jgi:hypothetical protein